MKSWTTRPPPPALRDRAVHAPINPGQPFLSALIDLLPDATPVDHTSDLASYDPTFPFYDTPLLQYARKHQPATRPTTLGQCALTALRRHTKLTLGPDPGAWRRALHLPTTAPTPSPHA